MDPLAGRVFEVPEIDYKVYASSNNFIKIPVN